MKPALDGKLIEITATFECGACGERFMVAVDPAPAVPRNWSAYDLAVDAVRGRGSSVQGDYILCKKCTRKCDTSALIPPHRHGTREEVRRALGID